MMMTMMLNAAYIKE